MTREELDQIDHELRAIAIDGATNPGAAAAARDFNARLERERARLAAIRAQTDAGTGAAQDELVRLRAAAVMWREERARIVQLYRLRA